MHRPIFFFLLVAAASAQSFDSLGWPTLPKFEPVRERPKPLPDACARLDMPSVPALREECDAATREKFGVSAEWYAEHGHHAKLNATRTLPEACGYYTRQDECIEAIIARTDAAFKEWQEEVANYTQGAWQYGTDTASIAVRIDKDAAGNAPYLLMNLMMIVLYIYFLCTSSLPRRS